MARIGTTPRKLPRGADKNKRPSRAGSNKTRMVPKRFGKGKRNNQVPYVQSLGSLLEDKRSSKSREIRESKFDSSLPSEIEIDKPLFGFTGFINPNQHKHYLKDIQVPEDYATETEKIKNPKFSQLLDKMAKIHNKKNQDYASDSNPYSNFEFAAAYAQIPLYKVYLVLEGIKTARLHELLGKGKVPNNESIDDTLLDLAVYSALRASNLINDNETKSQSTTKDGDEV